MRLMRCRNWQSKQIMKLALAIFLLSIVYVLGWYQLHGQFLSDWFKKYEYYLIWISVPTTLLSIRAIKLVNEFFNGQIWPNRILTFTIGIILFSILTSFHFGEKLSLKTLTLLLLCFIIVTLQVLWKWYGLNFSNHRSSCCRLPASIRLDCRK